MGVFLHQVNISCLGCLKPWSQLRSGSTVCHFYSFEHLRTFRVELSRVLKEFSERSIRLRSREWLSVALVTQFSLRRVISTSLYDYCDEIHMTALKSKQHLTLLPKTATISNEFIEKFRSFDKVECCFDSTLLSFFGNNVAGFGNNVERNFVFFRQNRNKLNIFNLFRLWKFKMGQVTLSTLF